MYFLPDDRRTLANSFYDNVLRIKSTKTLDNTLNNSVNKQLHLTHYKSKKNVYLYTVICTVNVNIHRSQSSVSHLVQILFHLPVLTISFTLVRK